MRYQDLVEDQLDERLGWRIERAGADRLLHCGSSTGLGNKNALSG